MLVYAELPSSLTAPIQAPAPPPIGCKLSSGVPTPCVFDALMREEQWQELLRLVNEDRASSARLSGQSANGLTSRDAGPER